MKNRIQGVLGLVSCLLLLSPTLGMAKGAKPASVPANKVKKAKKVKKMMMWELKGKTATIYFFGSLHVANKSFYPLPSAVETAFRRSQCLVVEADIASQSQSQIQRYTMKYGTYIGTNLSLEKDLSKKGMAKLKAYLKKQGIPLGGMRFMRPWLLGMTITVLGLQKAGFSQQYGLDMYFLRKARRRIAAGQNMKVMELESVLFQLKLFSSFTKKMQEAFLLSSLIQSSQLKKYFKALDIAWKTGDLKGFEKWMSQFSKSPDSKIVNDKMFRKRNIGMTNKIIQYLKTKKTYFVVVGTGHLVGKDSVIDMLQKKGYSPKQCSTDHFKSTKKKAKAVPASKPAPRKAAPSKK